MPGWKSSSRSAQAGAAADNRSVRTQNAPGTLRLKQLVLEIGQFQGCGENPRWVPYT